MDRQAPTNLSAQSMYLVAWSGLSLTAASPPVTAGCLCGLRTTQSQCSLHIVAPALELQSFINPSVCLSGGGRQNNSCGLGCAQGSVSERQRCRHNRCLAYAAQTPWKGLSDSIKTFILQLCYIQVCRTLLQGWHAICLAVVGKAGDKQSQHPDLDSASETRDEDAMSDADEDNDDKEANLHLDAERKLMHSVLSQFDDGAAAAGQEDLEHPEKVREAPYLQHVVPPTGECSAAAQRTAAYQAAHRQWLGGPVSFLL